MFDDPKDPNQAPMPGGEMPSEPAEGGDQGGETPAPGMPAEGGAPADGGAEGGEEPANPA